MSWFDRFNNGGMKQPPQDDFLNPDIPLHDQPQLKDSSAMTPGESNFLLNGKAMLTEGTAGALDWEHYRNADNDSRTLPDALRGGWSTEASGNDMKSQLLGPKDIPGIDRGFQIPPKEPLINVQPGGAYGPKAIIDRAPEGVIGKILSQPKPVLPPKERGQMIPKEGPDILKDHGTHGDNPDDPHQVVGLPGWSYKEFPDKPHEKWGYGYGYNPEYTNSSAWGLKEQANSDQLNMMFGYPVHPDLNAWKTEQHNKEIADAAKAFLGNPNDDLEDFQPPKGPWGILPPKSEEQFPTKWGGKFPVDHGDYGEKYPNIDALDIPQNEFPKTGIPADLSPEQQEALNAFQEMKNAGHQDAPDDTFQDTLTQIINKYTAGFTPKDLYLDEGAAIEAEADKLLQEDFAETGDAHGIIDPAIGKEKPLQSLIDYYGFNESYSEEDALKKIYNAYEQGYITDTDQIALADWAGENQEWQEENYFSEPEKIQGPYWEHNLKPATFSDAAKETWAKWNMQKMTPEKAQEKTDELYDTGKIDDVVFEEFQDYILKNSKGFPFSKTSQADLGVPKLSPGAQKTWDEYGFDEMDPNDALQSISSLGFTDDELHEIENKLNYLSDEKAGLHAPDGWDNTGAGGGQHVMRGDVKLRGADLARRIYENPNNKFKSSAEGMAHPDTHRKIEAEIRDAMTPEEARLYSNYTGAPIHGGGAGKKMEIFANAIRKNRRYQEFLAEKLKTLPETVIVYHGGKLSGNHPYFNGSLVEETSRGFLSGGDLEYQNLDAVAVPREAIIGLGSSMESEVIIDRHLMEALKKNRAPKFERPPVDDTGFNLSPPDDDETDLSYGNDPRINQRAWRYGRTRKDNNDS